MVSLSKSKLRNKHKFLQRLEVRENTNVKLMMQLGVTTAKVKGNRGIAILKKVRNAMFKYTKKVSFEDSFKSFKIIPQNWDKSIKSLQLC